MEELKLGVVACLHGNLKKARKIATKFKDVDAIILNGDIPSDKNQYSNFIGIVNVFVKTKKKIFLQPGSHESYKDYTKVIKKFKNKVVDCTKNQKHKLKKRNLVFLPSSIGSAPGSGYRVLKDRKQVSKWNKFKKLKKEHFTGKVKVFFISDLTKLINKKTIIISHGPPKFNKKEAIDLAKFGEPRKTFTILKKHRKYSKTTKIEEMTKGDVVFTLKEALKFKKLGYPITIKEKNVGNEYLKKLIKKKKITKLICGHIHESGGKACDLRGRKVPPNKFSKELFLNSGEAKKGLAAIVTIKGDLAKYNKIKV